MVRYIFVVSGSIGDITLARPMNRDRFFLLYAITISTIAVVNFADSTSAAKILMLRSENLEEVA